MTDLEYAKLEDDIRRKVGFWQESMGLSQWKIQVFVHRTENDWISSGGTSGHETYARCIPTWHYETNVIHFNGPTITKMWAENVLPKSTLDELIVHELVHCFTQELEDRRHLKSYDDYQRHEEHATSSIAGAILSVHKLGLGTSE